MSDTKMKTDDIIKHFGYGNTSTSKQLFEFYRMHEADLNENTFRWRIYALKKEGLSSLARILLPLRWELNCLFFKRTLVL